MAAQVVQMMMVVWLDAKIQQLTLWQAPTSAMNRIQAQASGLKISVSGAEEHQKICSVA